MCPAVSTAAKIHRLFGKKNVPLKALVSPTCIAACAVGTISKSTTCVGPGSLQYGEEGLNLLTCLFRVMDLET